MRKCHTLQLTQSLSWTRLYQLYASAGASTRPGVPRLHRNAPQRKRRKRRARQRRTYGRIVRWGRTARAAQRRRRSAARARRRLKARRCQAWRSSTACSQLRHRFAHGGDVNDARGHCVAEQSEARAPQQGATVGHTRETKHARFSASSAVMSCVSAYPGSSFSGAPARRVTLVAACDGQSSTLATAVPLRRDAPPPGAARAAVPRRVASTPRRASQRGMPQGTPRERQRSTPVVHPLPAMPPPRRNRRRAQPRAPGIAPRDRAECRPEPPPAEAVHA